METNDTYFNLIEDYFEGLLSEEAKRSFETRLESDKNFKERFQKHKDAHKLLELSAGHLLKEKLKSIQSKSEETPVKKLLFTKYAWGLAAIILVLIMFAGIRTVKNDYTDQALLSEHASPYATGPVRGENNQTEWTAGANAYLNKDYKAAINNFSQIKESSPRYIESRFFLGNSALLIGRYELAISALEEVVKKNDQRFMAAAEWYQILAFLGKGDEEAARMLAEKIFSEQNHAYRDHADRFLSDLNSFWR